MLGNVVPNFHQNKDYVRVDDSTDVEETDPDGLFGQKSNVNRPKPLTEALEDGTRLAFAPDARYSLGKVTNDEGDEESGSDPYENLKGRTFSAIPLSAADEAAILSDDDDDDDNNDNADGFGEETKYSGAYRRRTQNNTMKTSGELTNALDAWGVILCMLHMGVYLYFLFEVLFRIPWKRGFYGGPFPHESAYVSDHFGLFWALAVITLTNIFVPATVFWILVDVRDYIRKDLGLSIVAVQGVLALFTLVSLAATLIGYCNTGVFRNAVCDDPDETKYCNKWASDNPLGCPRGGVSDNTVVLSVNVIQYRWMVVSALFLAIDAAIGYTIYKIQRYSRVINWGGNARVEEDTSVLYAVRRRV